MSLFLFPFKESIKVEFFEVFGHKIAGLHSKLASNRFAFHLKSIINFMESLKKEN